MSHAPAGFGSKAKLSRESRKASRTALQNAAVEAKHSREADHFFSAARRNAGRRRPKQSGESIRELFKATDQGSGGINFDKYDAIEVTRSGPDADSVPSLETFAELYAHIPIWLQKNIDRMGYKKPTPIQKHAVPLIISGRDVLCAAQTEVAKRALSYCLCSGAFRSIEKNPPALRLSLKLQRDQRSLYWRLLANLHCKFRLSALSSPLVTM